MFALCVCQRRVRSSAVCLIQIQRRAVSVRPGSGRRGGGGAGAVLAAVRAALLQRDRSEGGAAVETLLRHAVRTRIHQVSHLRNPQCGLNMCP